MTSRMPRRLLVGAVVTVLVAFGVSAVSPSAAQVQFEQQWRVQSEVGGDIGGRSEVAVSGSEVSIEARGGAYAGTVSYSDRLVFQDPQGGVLVQVSRIDLSLSGLPAAGGGGMGGMFEGTARLDDYLGLTWEQATSGDLPQNPTRSGTYSVAGRWGAWLSGRAVDGELLFESANLKAKAGAVDVRNASWFNRYGSVPAQPFTANVTGTLPTGGAGGTGRTGGTGASGTSAGTASTADYLRAGLTGEPGSVSFAAVPLSSALGARALRDAKPRGATALPADSLCIDIDIAGLALDAKNRATGQRSDSPAGKRAARVWGSSRGAATATATSAETTASELSRILRGQAKLRGAPELLEQVEVAVADGTSVQGDTAEMLAEWLMTARAVSRRAGSVLAPSAEAAADVRDAPVPRSGPAAEGLLADADSPSAPAGTLEVTRFDRRATADVSVVGSGTGLLREVLVFFPLQEGAPVVRFPSARGAAEVSPKKWLAYRRADGVTFWLAGADGPVALRDGTLAGWAYTWRRMLLVSSSRCGQALEVLSAGAHSSSSGE